MSGERALQPAERGLSGADPGTAVLDEWARSIPSRSVVLCDARVEFSTLVDEAGDEGSRSTLRIERYFSPATGTWLPVEVP